MIELDEITAELTTAAQAIQLGYPRTEQDRLDLRHVADAVASDLRVVITRDQQLTGNSTILRQGRWSARAVPVSS